MIPNIAAACQGDRQENPANPDAQKDLQQDWQKALAQAIREPRELLALLGLSEQDFPQGILPRPDFPLRVPHSYTARMRHGDASDPLLLQVLAQQAEMLATADYVADPVGDKQATVSPGLLHKYQGRVLLVTTAACPLHCRYCFRRHFPYGDNHLHDQAWQQAIDYIAADSSIQEVILSGGDPLSLSNQRLGAIGRQLAAIPHLQRLRIHSRMPLALPQRIDEGFCNWLRDLPWQTIMVSHCNHANEIDPAVRQAFHRLKNTGTTLLNQAVLLKGVNDNSDAQAALAEQLFAAGVLPYYLHLLDRVAGASHFEVDETSAAQLMSELRRRLPGYLVPRLVREQAGAASKLPLA